MNPALAKGAMAAEEVERGRIDAESEKGPSVGWDGRGELGAKVPGGWRAQASLPGSQQHRPGGQWHSQRRGWHPGGFLLSPIFSCKNHKALNPAMQSMKSAWAQRGAGVGCGRAWCKAGRAARSWPGTRSVALVVAVLLGLGRLRSAQPLPFAPCSEACTEKRSLLQGRSPPLPRAVGRCTLELLAVPCGVLPAILFPERVPQTQ